MKKYSLWWCCWLRMDLKMKCGLFFTDEWSGTLTLSNSKARRTAAATVCQQNLHCCSFLISITLSCLSSSPRSCRLRSEYSDGLSHSEQQAKPEWCAQKTWSKHTNFPPSNDDGRAGSAMLCFLLRLDWQVKTQQRSQRWGPKKISPATSFYIFIILFFHIPTILTEA